MPFIKIDYGNIRRTKKYIRNYKKKVIIFIVKLKH